MISLQKLLQWILDWWRKDDHKERGSLSSAVIQKYHHCFPTFSGDEFVTRCFFHEYDNSFTLYIRYVFWPSVACGIGTNVYCASKQEVINDIKIVRVSDHSDLKYLLTKVYFPFHFLKTCRSDEKPIGACPMRSFNLLHYSRHGNCVALIDTHPHPLTQ